MRNSLFPTWLNVNEKYDFMIKRVVEWRQKYFSIYWHENDNENIDLIFILRVTNISRNSTSTFKHDFFSYFPFIFMCCVWFWVKTNICQLVVVYIKSNIINMCNISFDHAIFIWCSPLKSHNLFIFINNFVIRDVFTL